MTNNNSVEYVQVPMVELDAQNQEAHAPENNVQQPVLSEEELLMMKKSRRWIIVLCFVQLVVAFFGLTLGGLIFMCVSALFISIGVVGAAKQRVKLLTVHFIFSLCLYILSLIGVVVVILYCVGCKWWIYLIGFFVILFQAIGMKHARILIFLLRKRDGTDQCMWRCKSQMHKNLEACNVPEAPAPTHNFSAYPLPSHQVVSMQGQPQLPQYFPMQNVQYPMMQYPVNVGAPFAPQNGQTEQGQPQGQQPQIPYGLYPVVYRQI